MSPCAQSKKKPKAWVNSINDYHAGVDHLIYLTGRMSKNKETDPATYLDNAREC